MPTSTLYVVLADPAWNAQEEQEMLPFSPLTAPLLPPRPMAAKLTLFQAFHLIKAVSVLLNFSQEEENMLKETLEYKVGFPGLLSAFQNL